ncbi:alpha/beta hydrolase [Mucilaginibacter sp. KACC 22063]|uniref:alpha/beta hydrolase n=1 Tax=Mucilaginibacter sp. KACC 22063 TaxID=3025666 RepID=UPI0023667AD8|nr:alpha/beta hydrolase [Mucilaginibacter sp. KACC 22063]WDF56276.1 alpha/beta hydrolase [Mucilaginibacter sp. KACC 22063]
MRNRFLLTLFAAMLFSKLFAQQAEPINLYPNGIPNSKPTPAIYKEKMENGDWVTLVSTPQLTPFLPTKDKANGTAIVICPGGGYAGLSYVKEGMKIAQRFNEIGVTAFLLKYRLPSDLIMQDRSIGPLQDAQRAIQIVRENAAKWNVDPNKIGIIGFSAGGHLASTAGTHFDKVVIENKANISVRPDFMALIYPVITFGEYTHQGSKENLVGKSASRQQVDLYSNEKQITANTPPVFIIHAQDDDVVPVQNTLMFYDALLKNKVKAEMHIYQSGGHGFGLNNPREKQDWFASLTEWMKLNGWVK